MTNEPQDDLVKRLDEGVVQRARRWSGDTHTDLGGSADEDATDELMKKAARRIEALQAELTNLKAIQKAEANLWVKSADRRVEEEREANCAAIRKLRRTQVVGLEASHKERRAWDKGRYDAFKAAEDAIRARSNDAQPDDVSGADGSVPEGWQLVPIEPTEEMAEAGRIAIKHAASTLAAGTSRVSAAGYAAMLSASPSPPVQERQEVGGEDVLAGDIIAACDEYGLAPDGTSIEAEAMFGLIRAISHARDRMAELHREHQPVGGGWQDISTAPKTRPIVVETEAGRIFKAKWVVIGDDAVGWGTVNEDDPCPTCWTDGFCWESNADEEPSDKPVRWCELHKHSPLPSPPELQSEPVGGSNER